MMGSGGEVGEQGTCSGHSLEEVEEEVNCQNKVVGKRASHSDTEEEVVRLEEGLLRKGTSEPAVWGEEGEQRDCRRGGRRNLLSYLGLRKEEGEEGGGRGKSLRKTLSGMFHLRRKRGGHQSSEDTEKQKGARPTGSERSSRQHRTSQSWFFQEILINHRAEYKK